MLPFVVLEINFELLLNEVILSSDTLASLKLEILLFTRASSIYPSLLIFICKIYIHPILCMGSFVNILVIKFLSVGERLLGKDKFWVFRTSIKLAIELDWKGQWPKSIS